MLTMLRCWQENEAVTAFGDCDSLLPNGYTGARFATGRGALAALIDHLAASEKAGRPIHVAMPAYIAEGVYAPFARSSHCHVHFYRLNPDLTPNTQDIEDLRNGPGLDLLMLVHYFGGNCSGGQARRIARECGAIVVDDMAHALFGFADGDRGQEEFGDFLLYSLNKFLPVPDGAILACRSQRMPSMPVTPEPSEMPPEALASYCAHLRLNARILAECSPAAAMALARESGSAYEHYYAEINSGLGRWKQSDFSRQIERKSDLARMRSNRVRNAEILRKGVSTPAVRLLSAPISGTAPFCLPALVTTGDRDGFVAAAAAEGLLLSTLVDKWDFRSADAEPERFEVEDDFLARHILIPVNEFIDEAAMARLVTILNGLS